MTNTTNSADVNSSHTSDGAPRSNLMTRDEFVKRVLHSGEITRVGQHLALVIFLVAEGKNQLKLSVRELETITGWSRQTISDHLSELDVFMRVTFGGGRAKTLFELQGVIETTIASAVVSGSRRPRLTQRVVAKEADTSVVASQIDTRPLVASQIDTRAVVASQVVASLLASQIATTPVMASQADTTPVENTVVASQIDTTRVVASLLDAKLPSIERESIYTYNNNLSLSTTPRASEEDDPVRVNCVAIHGPGFKLDLKAIDLAAGTIGMDLQLARQIAEICARGWAADGEKPRYPMAAVKTALMNHHNQVQVHEAKIEKAKEVAKPKESRAARLLRHVEQAADKEGRS